MLRVYLIILFVIVNMLALAQESVISENNRIFQQHVKFSKNSHLLKPSRLEISKDQTISMADKSPAFTVYRDNFFVTGVPLNKKINTETADVEFQISFKQRLTTKILPFNTFAYLTYTQKSFWNIYAESSPFRDTNYNPGIGLGKYLFCDNKLTGVASIQVMHESNGMDGDDSRSWNYLNLAMKYYINAHFSLGGEFCPPYSKFGTNSKDIIEYKGYGCFSANYLSNNQKWWLSADLLPIKGLGNINAALMAAFRPLQKSPQYLFVRFFQGYGESQKDYKKYAINIRFGICIKPDFFSVF